VRLKAHGCNPGVIEYNERATAGRFPLLNREESAMGAMKEFANLYYPEGALDPKTMQLVALASMAAAGCTS